jgi:hypothetical protein
MSEEQTTEQPVADPVSEEQPPAPVRNEPQAPDQRRRLRELLAIPDHQRTDAIWDEIIELEICLAPGNRVSRVPGSAAGTRATPGSGRPGAGAPPGAGKATGPDAGAKPQKRFFKKSKRPPGSPPKTGG